MNGMPFWARAGLNSGNGLRFGVALTLASALHAVIILGIDIPWGDGGISIPAIDITLTVDAAPRFKGTRGGTPDSADTHVAADIVESAPPRTAGVDQETLQAAIPVAVPATVRTPDEQAAPAPAASTSPSASPTSAAGTPAHSAREFGGLPYTDLAREIADAHAQREWDATAQAGTGRSKRLTSASAKTAVEAAYLDMWRQKIERIGRANYPPGAYSGELLLLAVIHHDGALREVRVLESSGHQALDAAATRIVQLGAPYSHFPTEMRKSYDQIEIVRRWRFARDGAFL